MVVGNRDVEINKIIDVLCNTAQKEIARRFVLSEEKNHHLQMIIFLMCFLTKCKEMNIDISSVKMESGEMDEVACEILRTARKDILH